MNSLLKFSAINMYFIRNHNLLERGENSFMSGNVVRVTFDPKILGITAQVRASMKQRTYKVQILLTSDYNIEKASCDCPRGVEICHHIASAMFAARYELSKTDVGCSWVPVPKKDETKTCREVYNVTKPDRISQRDVYDCEIDEFVKELSSELCCGFVWLLKDEPEADALSCEVADVQSLISSDEYATSKNQTEWLKDKLKITAVNIGSIANATVGQHFNIEWLNIRRFRITASNFGALIGSIIRNRYPPSLFDRLMGQRDLGHIKSIQWGRTHEIDGIKFLEGYLQKTVMKTGVWLSESGLLGASPDGIFDDYAVEVKCRYKSRETILSTDLTTDTTYVITYNPVSHVWDVNKEHEYYHQIQGQIYLANKKGCYLVVWTPIETAIVLITKDESWGHWLKQMEKFYFERYIPFVMKNL